MYFRVEERSICNHINLYGLEKEINPLLIDNTFVAMTIDPDMYAFSNGLILLQK